MSAPDRRPLAAYDASRQGVPPPPPAAPRSGIGQRLPVGQPQYAFRPSPLAQSVEAPSAAVPQQNQTRHIDGRGLAPMAPRTRPRPIRQPADAEPMVELGRQGQPALRRTVSSVRSRVNPSTVCHTIRSPGRFMVVCGCTPVIAATDAADKVFCCLPHNSSLCVRGTTVSVKLRVNQRCGGLNTVQNR